MDRVVLRRPGTFVPLYRPLQVAGYGIVFAGTAAIGYLIAGLPAFVVMGAMAIAAAAVNAFPLKILTVDRDGISNLAGRRQGRLGWERISLFAVFQPRGGTVTVTPEVGRRLPSVHIDPARLTAAAPHLPVDVATSP